MNLLLNRASPWADVDSHLPYTGQVDIKTKQGVDLSVRIPEWVSPQQAQVRVNDRQVGIRWDGRYASVGETKPGDVVTVVFPVTECEDTIWIEKQPYKLTRKGNEVVAIDPPGQYCSLYQRAFYRENTTRWRKIERFVSEEQV